MITLEHVSFSIGEKEILHDISFHISKGSFTAIVGPNGSGKTTLLQCILHILPARGSIYIENQPVNTYRTWQHIGSVHQMSHNYNASIPISVSEVIEMGFQKTVDAETIDTILQMVDMVEYRDKPINTLSGGQQQKIFIARSFVTNPCLLVYDEPTVGLDRESVRAFYDRLACFQQEGKTIVIVSHDFHLLDQRITQVIHLDQGRVRFCGSRVDYVQWHAQECTFCEEIV